MATDLSTAYQPREIEQRWYQWWEERGLFRAQPNAGKTPYCIVIPPPNVTGSLHMGHAFEHTLQDLYIRRARMQGFEALWLPGTDHAGIATQNVVERELLKQGVTRHDLGRDAFIERVWEWKAQYGGRIAQQMRRLGNSCDWERERFTMDEGLSLAVRTVFVRWFEEGLIYRGLRIINWCPRCTTALSDIEVEHEDKGGELVTFRYPLADGSGSISVATTRVETMLGDTGIAVHPDDERYKRVIGKKVRHPFFAERDIPVVGDEAVDPEFGTGAVKVTPAHDPTDFEIGERQGLEQVNIFDRNARTNDNAGDFAGVDRYEARGRVLEALRADGLIEREERPYLHSVGHCSRCGTEIEPWLSEQWFVRMEPLAEPAIAAVRDGDIRFEPERFVKQYIDWMENVRDWCISRQLWWGHRIPVWYCDACGETFASLDDPDSCRSCRSSEMRQDEDVLDTWFSSQLWPFSTLGWPKQTDDLSYFYPTTLMAPGYEILFLWVARMISSGLYFMRDVPFHDVFIHGMVRDFEGKKMSKSKGNVVDPLDIIERYGADALRFSLAFAALPGSDTNVSEDRIEGARNFANKLWNASRFVLLALGDERPELPDQELFGIEERWILSRLEQTIETVDEQLSEYAVAEAMRALYRFTWSEYCDWFIEMSKLYLEGERGHATKAVLLYVLDRILRLLHPVMPFITEELWSRLRPDAGSIMVAAWPAPQGQRFPEEEAALERFQDLVVTLRRLRSEHAIEPSNRIPVSIGAGRYTQELQSLRAPLEALARLESADIVETLPASDGAARAVSNGGIEASIDLAEVIDVDRERERLRARIAELDAEVARATGKLANDEFVQKAPSEVVDRERHKLEEYQSAKDKLAQQLERLNRQR